MSDGNLPLMDELIIEVHHEMNGAFQSSAMTLWWERCVALGRPEIWHKWPGSADPSATWPLLGLLRRAFGAFDRARRYPRCPPSGIIGRPPGDVLIERPDEEQPATGVYPGPHRMPADIPDVGQAFLPHLHDRGTSRSDPIPGWAIQKLSSLLCPAYLDPRWFRSKRMQGNIEPSQLVSANETGCRVYQAEQRVGPERQMQMYKLTTP